MSSDPRRPIVPTTDTIHVGPKKKAQARMDLGTAFYMASEGASVKTEPDTLWSPEMRQLLASAFADDTLPMLFKVAPEFSASGKTSWANEKLLGMVLSSWPHRIHLNDPSLSSGEYRQDEVQGVLSHEFAHSAAGTYVKDYNKLKKRLAKSYEKFSKTVREDPDKWSGFDRHSVSSIDEFMATRMQQALDWWRSGADKTRLKAYEALYPGTAIAATMVMGMAREAALPIPKRQGEAQDATRVR